MTRLIDNYDAALFDLDGVVYLGPQAIPAVTPTITQLRAEHTLVGFVTNNAGRPPQAVVDQLRGFGMDCELSDVVTSAQAGAEMLSKELNAADKVLVCGAQCLADEVSAAGFEVVSDYRANPVAVIQGYDHEMTWPRLEQAVFALQRGARWFATNTDSTRPTDLGLVPGAGAQVASVATCVSGEPMVAGKPYPSLLNYTVRRLGAKQPIFVGDRLDTDIQGANNVNMDSLFVFSGTHGKYDLAAAVPAQRPTAIGLDVAALLSQCRVADVSVEFARCGAQQVTSQSGRLVLVSQPEGAEQQLDALWAGLQLVWADQSLDIKTLLEALDELH